MEKIPIPPWRKYSLSVEETSALFGIGEKRVYDILRSHEGAQFILEIGSHVRIKRVLFEKYLDEVTTL